MSEEKNKNLEEFFNKSLEHFDDGPSEGVWEGLADRLDSEQTFFQRWKPVLLRWLPLLLLLLGFGGYHLYVQDKFDQLNDELLSIQQENATLSLNLNDCSTTQQQLQTQNIQFQSELQLFADQLNEKNNLLSLSRKSPVPIQGINIRDYSKNHNLTFNKILEPKFENNKVSSIALPIKSEDNTSKENVEFSSAESNSLSKQSSSLPMLKMRAQILSFKVARPYTYGFAYNTRINKKEEESSIFKYRIGYTGRTITTAMKGIGNGGNLGSGHGIRQEISLSKKWWLTNDLRFNHQHYERSESNGFISPLVLNKYPMAANLGDLVTKIKVSSKYFDASLGFKWNFWSTTNGLNFYVNPSAIWQIYLPQDFEYELFQGGKIKRSTDNYWAYFGSGNLNIGFEKNIRHNLIWQFGLWGEHSFIPLGVENQSITQLGLTTSFLFGK